MSTDLTTPFPTEYDPIQAGKVKIKINIDHHEFTLYIKMVDDEPNMGLHKYLEFISHIFEECTRESESAEAGEEILGRLLHKTWARCLPSIELAVWNNLPDYNGVPEFSMENWQFKIRDWIGHKCTTRETAAVLQQLRTWKKPKNVSVLANQLYMMKVNNSIEFMPVSEGQAPLTEAQFKEAFFACHPYQWQQSFREHNEPSEVDIGRIASFMRLKAQNAAKRERDNQLKQKSNGKKHRRNYQNGSPKEGSPSNKKQRKNPEDENYTPEEWKKRIAHLAQTSNPNDMCTLKKSHKNHTIGKCKIINAYKKANKNSIESNAIQCLTVDKVDTDSTTSKESEA